MAKANPPIIVLRSTKFGSEGYKRALEDIIFQLWVKSGGSEDSLSVGAPLAQSVFAYIDTDEVNPIHAIPDEEPNSFNAVSVSSDYTAISFDFINATNGASIIFPANPAENDIIVVRNGDKSKINLDGNGRKINGSLSGAIRKEGTCIEFYYFIKTNEWLAK